MTAEVSADDVSLVLTSQEPLLVATELTVEDSGSPNPNGRLDPGETAPLTATVRNFGEPATDITVTLASGSNWVTVPDPVSDLPDLGTGEAAAASFTVGAAADTPEGTRVPLAFDVTWSAGTHSSSLDLIVGRLHALVWDPTPAGSSGPALATTLRELGFAYDSCSRLSADWVDGYQCLFVSLGVPGLNHVVPAGSADALAIEAFLDGGGHVYLEGADCWVDDPAADGHDFGPRFGILGVSGGSADLVGVNGEPGTFTEGMTLIYDGANLSIDRLWPVADAVVLFRSESLPSYICAVGRDGEPGRTVGASFEFGGLLDFVPPSTRADLLHGIMNFFLTEDVTRAPESTAPPATAVIKATPNPFNPRTEFLLSVPRTGHVGVDVLDLRGRRLVRLIDGWLPAGHHRVAWDGRDAAQRPVASGVYLARIVVGRETAQVRVVLVR